MKRSQTHKYKHTISETLIHNSAGAIRQHHQQKDTPVTCSAIPRFFQPPSYNHNLRVAVRMDRTLELPSEIRGPHIHSGACSPLQEGCRKPTLQR